MMEVFDLFPDFLLLIRIELSQHRILLDELKIYFSSLDVPTSLIVTLTDELERESKRKSIRNKKSINLFLSSAPLSVEEKGRQEDVYIVILQANRRSLTWEDKHSTHPCQDDETY